MDRSSIAHELTILYLQNSVALSDFKSPEDYANVYMENYNKILSKLSASKHENQASKKHGVISHGIE